MRTFLFLILLFSSAYSLGAGIESLTLSDAEIQKLKAYFPQEEEHSQLVWKGEPLSVKVPIGKEKRIVFPKAVTVNVNGKLNVEQLRLLNNDKSIYLTALKQFPTTRVYVTLEETGKVILIDITPSETANGATQSVLLKDDEKKSISLRSSIVSTNIEDNDLNESGSSNSSSPSYIDLIRYAWANLYAPARLAPSTHGASRVPIKSDWFVPDLLYGDKVIAHPEISWVAGNYYVTAVTLHNKYPHATKINVQQDLCGDWLAASLYPRSQLMSQGKTARDNTTLFLVSNKPFNESLRVCHGNA